MSKTDSSEEIRKAAGFDHLFKIGELDRRSRNRHLSKATRTEAAAELVRYRDEGIIIQESKEAVMAERRAGKPMTMSGLCAFPSTKEGQDSHQACRKLDCSCDCHTRQKVFTGRGIIFAVIDDREKLPGRKTTVDVFGDAIEAALDAGKETSDEIAHYLVTSAFQHERDRRVRFNSVLKAGDVVGAQITRKLYNAYNELCDLADDAETDEEAQALRDEARGFAEALNIVMSPFSVEDGRDPRLVDWKEVDRITEVFEAEQAEIRQNGDAE